MRMEEKRGWEDWEREALEGIAGERRPRPGFGWALQRCDVVVGRCQPIDRAQVRFHRNAWSPFGEALAVTVKASLHFF